MFHGYLIDPKGNHPNGGFSAIRTFAAVSSGL